MGITGLLKILKPYTQPVHVRKYSGQRVGIDAYCWLHKGAYACSFGLSDEDQKISSMQPCVKYCMHYINLLRFNNVIPVVVFDGGRLPSKALTENERQRRRDLNRQQARLKLSEGDVNGAQEHCQRAVEITPLMAHEFIKVLKAEGVEFVVAPYEADAQLAYLSSLRPDKGGVAAVISEDSDLLAYGCNVVMYKMDRYGNGEEVRLEDILARKTTSEGPPNSLWFGCFTPDLFTGMCVLAGCDFLPSVPGIGIKRAHCLVCKYRDLARVLSSMRFDRKLVVPEGYELAFKQANAIFHHARVYDASARKLSFLKPFSARFMDEFNGDLDFLGPDLPPSRAFAIAEGRLDPISMRAFDELVCTQPQTALPIFPGKQPKPLTESSERRPNFRKEDVWLGTDEELFAMLSGVDASPSAPSSSPVSIDAATPLCGMQRDSGFVAHLVSMSSSRVVPEFLSEERGPPAAIVTLSPGKKRVLPPQPNNNPFKRGRMLDQLGGPNRNFAPLLNSEIDEQQLIRKYIHLGKASTTCGMQYGGDHREQVQSIVEACTLTKTEESFITKGGGSKAGLVPPHVQGFNRDQGYHNVASDTNALLGPDMVVDARTSMPVFVKRALVKAEDFGRKSVADSGMRGCETGLTAKLQESIEANGSKQQEIQDLPWQVPDQNLALQPSCSAPIASPGSGLEHTELDNAISDVSRSGVFSKRMQRDHQKIKKEMKSLRQSTKVVALSPTPGLLKFFERAPISRR